MQDAATPPGKKVDWDVGVLINTASGSSTESSAGEMTAVLAEFGITPVHLWCIDSSGIEEAFKESDTKSLDVLIVLGGDGTIRTAASRARATSPLLIPLPGGTMNVLPKALYGELDWKDALRATLTRPHEKSVSGGEVNGERFFISGIFGSPALWADVRESLRHLNVSDAFKNAKKALGHMFANKIRYTFNEMHAGMTEVLIVTCPLVSRSLEENRTVFEAAIIDVDHAGELLGLASAAAFGAWQENKNVAVVRTDHVTVSANHAIPLILDGESVSVGRKAKVSFITDAFRVLVPLPDEILS